MRVARWGNSLAIRLPASLVAELDLREGDEVDVSPASRHNLKIALDPRREEALARIRAMRVPLPPDYKFDREKVHEREPE